MFRVSLSRLLALLPALLLVAVRFVASARTGTVPYGVHLAFGRHDEHMVVTFHTFENRPTTVVEYRALGTETVERTFGVSRAFVDGGDEYLTRYMHHTTLVGLTQGAAYAYRVGVSDALKKNLSLKTETETETSSWSEWFLFRAKRSAEQFTESKPLKMLAWCDIGHLESRSTIAAVIREIHGDVARRDGESGDDASMGSRVSGFPDAMLHCGDLGYDLDTSNGRNGDAFLSDIEPIAAYVPYMVTAGNHERRFNFSHFQNRFFMPSRVGTETTGWSTDRYGFLADRGSPPPPPPWNTPTTNQQFPSNNHYYSFDLGPVHVLAWNSEAFFYPEYFDQKYAERMYHWMENDLRTANGLARRTQTPWIVALAHRYRLGVSQIRRTLFSDCPE
jgi:hypothetical protein